MLKRCNFFREFNQIECLRYIVRRISLQDQKKYLEYLNSHTKEAVFVEVANMVRAYNKNKCTPFIILDRKSSNIVGIIDVSRIEENEDAISISIEIKKEYQDLSSIITLLNKFVSFAKFVFKVRTVIAFCDMENGSKINHAYREYNMKYIMNIFNEKKGNKNRMYLLEL